MKKKQNKTKIQKEINNETENFFNYLMLPPASIFEKNRVGHFILSDYQVKIDSLKFYSVDFYENESDKFPFVKALFITKKEAKKYFDKCKKAFQ